MQLNQIALITGILELIDRQYPGASANPRQLNAVIAAADSIVAEFARADTPAVPGSGLRAWLDSDDTGTSSMAVARHLAPLAGMAERVPGPRYAGDAAAHPCDPADLGRVIRLCDAVPELRPHLPAMAEVSPIWAAMVARWDELEALYREELPSGEATKCYRLMQELQEIAP